jgi:hypothetical protein
MHHDQALQLDDVDIRLSMELRVQFWRDDQGIWFLTQGLGPLRGPFSSKEEGIKAAEELIKQYGRGDWGENLPVGSQPRYKGYIGED